MSWLLRSLITAVWAKEADRILAAAYDLANKAIVANADYLDLTGTPSAANIPDCVSLVTDPCGLGTLATWSATGGQLRLAQTNPGNNQPAGPAGLLANVTNTLSGAASGSLNTTVVPINGGQSYAYFYAFIDQRIGAGAIVTVSQANQPLATATPPAALAGAWELAAIPVPAVLTPAQAQQQYQNIVPEPDFSHVASGGTPAKWSTAIRGPIGGPINLVPNPSFEHDTVGSAPAAWAASISENAVGATLSCQTTVGGANGTKAMQISVGAVVAEGAEIALAGTFVAGQTYNLSLFLHGGGGSETVSAGLGVPGDLAQTGTLTLGSSWQRYNVTWTPTASRTGVTVFIQHTAATAVSFYADSVQVTLGAALLAYFDGDSPGYAWSGTVGNSTSQFVAAYADTVTNNSPVDNYSTVQVYGVGSGPGGHAGISIPLGDVPAGKTVTASVLVEAGNAGQTIYAMLEDNILSNGGQFNSITFTSSLQQGWCNVTWTSTADSPNAMLYVYVSSAAGGQTFYVRKAIVNYGAAAPVWSSGDSQGWAWAGTPGQSTSHATGAVTVSLATQSTPPSGALLAMTGVTYVEGKDPGGPFIGDMPAVANFAFGWQGVRNASPSVRYGQLFDLLSLHEQQHELPVAPQGLAPPPEGGPPIQLLLPASSLLNPSGQTLTYPNQRAAYLALRNAARKHPYSTTFATLIGLLIQTQVPTFNPAGGVQVITNYSNYSFLVNIGIDPTSALVQSVQRLINDIHPAHMRLTAINYSSFQADISQADIGHT